MIKYPSIVQFRNVIRDVTRHGRDPILKFYGTVKVHGTNASVVIAPDDTLTVQSKNNEINVDNDNAGFARWVKSRSDAFLKYKQQLIEDNLATVTDTVVIYGEFAGKGIQSGAAVTQVPKFFYCFGVRLISSITEKWIRKRPEFKSLQNCIIDALSVQREEIVIDFANPELAQNCLIAITQEIEAQCPVGMFFGVSGTGEGVVWEHITDNGELISFKVKGKKHNVSKVRTLAPVDVEKVNSIMEFVEYAVTPNRLEQAAREVLPTVYDFKLGIDSFTPDFDRKHLGSFIKWVIGDIIKEEIDVLTENELQMLDVNKAVSIKSKRWFFDQELI